MTTLDVFWETELVGRLTKADSKSGNQGMSFQYDPAFLGSGIARPISLSLPLQAEPSDGEVPRAWFANLLPEGEIRGHVARQLGVSERNEFALLAGIGGECAGALRLLSPAASPDHDAELVPYPWDRLEADIATDPRPSLLALALQKGELRLSLAGAQDKLPVHFAQGELALPRGQAASTHLLKISSGGFPDLVQNELFCLTLAREVGLPAAPAEMAATRTPILLVERYDRLAGPGDSISRLHQEDFCQALGLPPESKYENEGGPSLAEMFSVLARGSTTPLPDKRDLIRWVLFNFLIGNADAHAKNVSFLHGGLDNLGDLGDLGDQTGPRLAPFYDLVCTEVYDSLSSKQAQKIGGEYRPGHLARRHWERFAASIEINQKYLSSVALELCGKIAEKADLLAEEIGAAHGGAGTLAAITEVIQQRSGRLQRDLIEQA